MKLGPVVAMVCLLGLGAWVACGPLAPQSVRPGAHLRELQIGTMKGALESYQDPITGEWEFRILWRDGWSGPIMSRAQLEAFAGPRVAETTRSRNPILLFFNITSWTNLAWISVGLFGQVAFSGRMILQWVVSERRQESTVPVVFWWLSMVGGMALFSYFCWRQDFVGILGQAPGVVIYARNLWLIYKPRWVATPA